MRDVTFPNKSFGKKLKNLFLFELEMKDQMMMMKMMKYFKWII